MIPRWKLARELDRAGQQLRALFGLAWEPFAHRANDRRRAEILDVEDGRVPVGPKIALYLLYQPKGLLASTLLTCQHFIDKGYAPLVAFARFWRTFRVSSNKYTAVYWGERGFSHAMEGAGLRVDGVLDPGKLVAALESADDVTLRKTLTNAAYIDDDFRAENDALAGQPRSVNWRQSALMHVRRVVARRSCHASFPYASIRLLGTPYIKKSTGTFLKRTYGTLHSVMRRQYLAAVKAADLPQPFPEVLAEIQAATGGPNPNPPQGRSKDA